MSTFINERLLEKVAYGFIGGPVWSTTRVRLLSGRRKFNAERSQPLWRFTAPFKNIREEHHDIVLAQFNACLGPIHTFRFHNWMDYVLDDVTIGISVGGTDETIQIVKPYTFPGSATTLNKTITKPVDSTVYTEATPFSVTADDVPITFGIDYTTGIITLTGSRPGGEVIKVTGEYDVPVYFESDSLTTDYNTYGALTVDVVLEEDIGAVDP